MGIDQPQIPQDDLDNVGKTKESDSKDWKKSEIESLGNFSDNSLHYNIEAGLGSKLEDLSEEIGVGKQIARAMAYDRGLDVSATIKIAPGKVWMEVSLTDNPNRLVTNITAKKKGNEWLMYHMSLYPDEISIDMAVRLYHLLS
jgi:hypothetical protein